MCPPKRGLHPRRVQARQTLALGIGLGRKSLLLGTALASTLLLGTFAASPAQAESKEFGEFIVENNSAPRTTGIIVPIPATPLSEQNNDDPFQSITLLNGIVVNNSGEIATPPIAIETTIDNANIEFTNESLGLYTVIEQLNAVESEIIINNGGDLAAGDGIIAEVENENIDLENLAEIENDNSGIFDTLIQFGIAEQANAVVTFIAIENSADIEATLGIGASISNGGIDLRNVVEVFNDNIGDGNSLTQIGVTDQVNLLGSAIAIDNEDTITAVDGIRALITNNNTYLYNGCLCDVQNENDGLVGNLLQSANIYQINLITNSIAIENNGDIVADQNGIYVNILNLGAELVNDSGIVNSTDAGGYVTQTADTYQANVIANAIAINNDASIQADNGILAFINNGLNIGGTIFGAPVLTNASFAANSSGIAPPPHAIDTEQANIIANSIAIGNSGDITSDVAGIASLISNILTIDTSSSPNLPGNLVGQLTNGANGSFPDEITQSIFLDQTNIVASATAIDNSGNIEGGVVGIGAVIYNSISFLPNEPLPGLVLNNASADAGALVQFLGIAQSNTLASEIAIENSGTIESEGAGIAATIVSLTPVVDSFFPYPVVNFAGAVNESSGLLGSDLSQFAEVIQDNTVANDITIENQGSIDAAVGVAALLINDVVVGNAGFIENAGDGSVGGDLTQSLIANQANNVANAIAIENAGAIQAGAYGILAGIENVIEFYNYASAGNVVFQSAQQSLDVAQTNIATNDITIVNRGDITAGGIAIFAEIENEISFNNLVCLSCNTGPASVTQNSRLENSITIVNSGSVRGGEIGIAAGIIPTVFFDIPVIDPALNNTDRTVDSRIVIENTGLITAQSLFAIDTYGARTTIINANGGVIEGFVDLTDFNDRFDNQAGGTFEARRTSDFGGGNDLFRNEAGGTVRTASDPSRRETTTFVNLERFENRGLITLVDGRVGDTFEISNTSPAARDLTFVASGNSALAIDAFLGGPGSVADEFIIHGDISGRTALQVNNTNPNPGAAGAVIPVIIADGDQVNSNTFFLAQPIDTGFFEYDLFFRPTGSGIFELRSFVGGSAFLLPQLITAAQDIWHAGSSTWFDRTADLRVLLAGGGSPIAYDPTARYADVATAGPSAMTPAVWARGGGNWLDRKGSETVSAFGRDYNYNLDRDLEIIDFQMGLDLGKRDLLSQGDILVFGMLGGFVGADLDYNQLARGFDFEGGQVGGYATYLRGGLFVDTLLNAHLLELETATLGFPSSLDATTVGLRTDTGYRFGSFNGGAFIEPLATIAVLWSDIDGFASGGNRVSFDDEANVRGRLGMRVGTSMPVWSGTTMEPFVIGSLWGHLSGDNQASLVSTGTTFRFEDDLDDMWGEVSAGVNFFNPSASTAVFAKVDVTFGDDVDGIGGKAGMRVSW